MRLISFLWKRFTTYLQFVANQSAISPFLGGMPPFVPQRVAMCCNVLQCAAVYCSTLQRVAGHTMIPFVLQWVAVYMDCVLHWVAVYCCALQCVAVYTDYGRAAERATRWASHTMSASMLQHIVECSSDSKRVAVCCSVHGLRACSRASGKIS